MCTNETLRLDRTEWKRKQIISNRGLNLSS
jgi:hypothetical protein